MTQGSRITPENIRPIRYTPSSREARMARTGIGSDSSRSLSLAWYRPENVLNTLPNTPISTPTRAKRGKYSQSRPASCRGAHRPMENSVNIPPITPTISSTYSTIKLTVLALDRGLFFFAS